ncbi:putative uncharacterized protein [Clostridium sp. CAG:1024]|jgi:uncharacterized OB-fold protein|nr:putative uncharacterized protein [Clostridium sp. CAG:1024]
MLVDESEYPFQPRITHDSKPYWDGLKEHKVLFQRCACCGKPRMPTSIVCPFCLNKDFAWEESKGLGKVYTYAIYRHAFHPALKQKLPYAVATVDLDEGIRLLTNVSRNDMHKITCGTPVKIEFADTECGIVMPYCSCIAQYSQSETTAE